MFRRKKGNSKKETESNKSFQTSKNIEKKERQVDKPVVENERREFKELPKTNEENRESTVKAGFGGGLIGHFKETVIRGFSKERNTQESHQVETNLLLIAKVPEEHNNNNNNELQVEMNNDNVMLNECIDGLCDDSISEAIFELNNEENINNDKDVLMFLYHQTNGDQWKFKNYSHGCKVSWYNKKLNSFSILPLNQWYGIETINIQPRKEKEEQDAKEEQVYVESLSLHFTRLEGEIPKCLGKLAHLSTLILSCNALNGSLSSSALLSPESHLKILNLSGNQLTGPIPEELSQCSRLELLDLSYNFFEINIKIIQKKTLKEEVKKVISSDKTFRQYQQITQNNNLYQQNCTVGEETNHWLMGPEIGQLIQRLVKMKSFTFINLSGNCFYDLNKAKNIEQIKEKDEEEEVSLDFINTCFRCPTKPKIEELVSSHFDH